MKSLSRAPWLLLPLVSLSLCLAEEEAPASDSTKDTTEVAAPADKDSEPAPETTSTTTKDADFATAIVEECFSSIAIIEGDVGSGTGLIINEGDKTRLYTAAHVIAGNTRLTVKNSEGRQFTKFGTFEVAAKDDLARIELLEKFESKISIAAEGTCKVRDPLLAIGNSGGAGVLTLLKGDAKSLGPDSIEVSNQVIQGNSGGPVFSGNTGELVAVVTHATAAREDIWAKDTDFDEVRRFATRLDRKITWNAMRIGDFLKENDRIKAFNRNTQVLYAISVLSPTQEGLRLDVQVDPNGPTVLSIFEENKEMPTIASLLDMNVEMGSKSMRIAESDLRKRFGRFYGNAQHELNKDSKAFLPRAFSGYKQAEVAQAIQWRADALKKVKSAESSYR